MSYVTWVHKVDETGYGLGPEYALLGASISSYGILVDGEVQLGGTVLGFVSKKPNEKDFTDWHLKTLTSEEALDFAKKLVPDSFLVDDELKITYPDIHETTQEEFSSGDSLNG